MRFPLLFMLVLLVINALVDTYIYCAIYSSCRRKLWPGVQLVSAVMLALLLVALCILPKRAASDGGLQVVMWGLYTYVSFYIPKYIFLVFDILSRIPCLWHGARWRWMSLAGAVAGALAFVLMWLGVPNARRMSVSEVEVEVKDLPPAFGGYRIVQLSDIHSGTYGSDTSYLAKVVEKVNSLQPDLILFTGDIVNRHSQELKPFTSTLSRLSAPDGVYAVLGNHDYGDYCQWPDEQCRLADVDSLKAMERAMGWKMLNNSHAFIVHGSDTLALVGVENIGDPPFKVYGNLDAAYPDLRDSRVKILLSHNPAHWDKDIENKDLNIALTLSGHTHAMQTEILGMSPAAMRYRHWGGLYTDRNGRSLYVNIGLGTVGMPSRIGATPEITLITLK